jgi:cyclopropane fatty-acyl-phospholipid synthase-like methyltransferase
MRLLDVGLQRARIKRAVKHIRPDSLILDIGCHQGELSNFAAVGHSQYFGIDPDLAAPATTLARGRFPDDVPAGWKELLFDHCVALAVLEHVPIGQLTGFLESARALLRPAGTLIATVPSPATDRVLAVLHRLRLIDGMDLEAHDGLTLAQLLEAAAEAGFRLVRHDRFQLGMNNLLIWERP